MTSKYTINQIQYIFRKSLQLLAETKQVYHKGEYEAVRNRFKLDRTLIKNNLKKVTSLKKKFRQ